VPNWTLVALARLVPVIVTVSPGDPLVGLMLAIVGAAITVKLVDDVAVPDVLVTAIGPVVAPLGTRVKSDVSLINDNVVAGVPLNATPVVPVKLLPVIVTFVYALLFPLVGLKLVMTGTAANTVWLARRDTTNAMHKAICRIGMISHPYLELERAEPKPRFEGALLG
jgi:hypothetical protein